MSSDVEFGEMWVMHESNVKKQCVRGDIDENDSINVLDIVLLVNMILDSQKATYCADINKDSVLNVLDIVLIVNIILGV